MLGKTHRRGCTCGSCVTLKAYDNNVLAEVFTATKQIYPGAHGARVLVDLLAHGDNDWMTPEGRREVSRLCQEQPVYWNNLLDQAQKA
jgi:hypothetical protein